MPVITPCLRSKQTSIFLLSSGASRHAARCCRAWICVAGQGRASASCHHLNDCLIWAHDRHPNGYSKFESAPAPGPPLSFQRRRPLEGVPAVQRLHGLPPGAGGRATAPAAETPPPAPPPGRRRYELLRPRVIVGRKSISCTVQKCCWITRCMQRWHTSTHVTTCDSPATPHLAVSSATAAAGLTLAVPLQAAAAAAVAVCIVLSDAPSNVELGGQHLCEKGSQLLWLLVEMQRTLSERQTS